MDPFNSKFILKEKRWLWVDYDKGISIMLVGYGHCMASLNGHVTDLSSYPFFTYFGAFFFGFRMPLFFIISGLLVGRSLNKKGLNNYIGDRTNNILYPLMIWGAIQVTLQIIAARFTTFTFHDSDVGAIDYLKLLFDPRQIGQFWYLNALFCIGVLYATIRSKFKLKPIYNVLLGLVLYGAAGYLNGHGSRIGFLNDVLEYYFFFALGDLISNIVLNDENIKRFSSWKIFVPLAVLFAIVQYYFTRINLSHITETERYVEEHMPFFFLLEALLGCTASVSFSFLLQKYKVFTWIRIVGYHSLFIYCMQVVVMQFARIFLQSFLHITYTPALILLILASGIVLPIFFYNFCLKFKLWWLFTFRKPEKQVEYLRNTNIFSIKRQGAI
jgi:fucose 4-O-acetylase-like acetyltransferase